MADFDNVKVMIRDKNKNYLVGRRYDKKFKYSTLGGHKENEEKWFQTLARELNEETSGVLELVINNNKFYIFDGKKYFPVKEWKKYSQGKQIYVVFDLVDDISRYMKEWRRRLINNQEKIIFDELEYVQRKHPNITLIRWIEYFIKYKDNYSNLQKVLKNYGLTKQQINRLISEFDDISVYLEMDDLDLVSKSDLSAEDGLYERKLIRLL